MAFNYDKIAATASKLLARFGRDQVLRTKTVGTFDPVTGAETGASTADVTVKGLQQSLTPENINGKNIQVGDRLFVIDSTQTPALTDKFKVGSEYWQIINIDTKEPAGTAIVHIIQVRK